MKFPELCERLLVETGRANVTSNLYPGVGSTNPEADLGLWVHDEVFEVGTQERGKWFSDRVFSDEDEACAYMYERMTRKPNVWAQTPEEREHSRQVTEDYTRKLKERLRKREQ